MANHSLAGSLCRQKNVFFVFYNPFIFLSFFIAGPTLQRRQLRFSSSFSFSWSCKICSFPTSSFGQSSNYCIFRNLRACLPVGLMIWLPPSPHSNRWTKRYFLLLYCSAIFYYYFSKALPVSINNISLITRYFL